MAQAGFTPISLYFSSTAAAVPSSGNLVNGELALNTADMKLYAKNSAGTVTLLASSGGATGTVSSVAATVPAFLSITGSPITTSGTLAISLSGSALPTTSGGTGLTSFNANGVVYASSSSALATSSALTWDAQKFEIVPTSDSFFTGGLRVSRYTGGNLQYGTITNNGGLAITAVEAAIGTPTIQFLTSTNGSTTTERMRIDSSKVSVKSTGSSSTQGFAVEASANDSFLSLYNNASVFNIEATWSATGSYQPIAFITSGSERLRIAANGAFGLSGANYGLAGQVLTSSGSSSAPTWASAGGGSGFTAKTANYTAVSGDNILANTSSGSWTLTLPSSPSTGNAVQVMDSIGTFGQYPLTVARNGSTIMGAAENMTMAVNGAATTFVYNGSTWRVI
jgi:hypothetical protein